MSIRRSFLLLLFTIGLFAAAASAWAGGTVQLNIVGDGQGAALVFQEWSQALGKAGIRNVRIRSATDSDKPGIETEGEPNNRVYVVTGVITSRDELVLPGARFRRGDLARLATWLKDLAENGPVTGREIKSPLGLSAADFNKVRTDLATPIVFSTVGMTRQKAVEKIAGQLGMPLNLDADVARALADEKIEDDLINLSCGTALACILRPAGYSLMPRVVAGQVAYTVVKSEGKPADSNIANLNISTLKTWPLGWTSDKSDHDAVPSLFTFHNVNVQNVSIATAIEAIGKRVKIPVVIDRKALSQNNIDLTKASVSLPSKRTTYGLALRKLLFQARLKSEVHYDDAGTPFLWVTTLKPAD